MPLFSCKDSAHITLSPGTDKSAVHLKVISDDILTAATPGLAGDLQQRGLRVISDGILTLIETFPQQIDYASSQAAQSSLSAQEALRIQHLLISLVRRPHRRPRNRRAQMVQAKRKRLGLSPDGKCLGLGRRESYAYRLAEEASWGTGEASPYPRLADFRRHIPARRKRKMAARWRHLQRQIAQKDVAFFRDMRSADESIATSFGLSPAELSTESVDNWHTRPALWWTSADNQAAHEHSTHEKAGGNDA